jgi:hypothetical protein
MNPSICNQEKNKCIRNRKKHEGVLSLRQSSEVLGFREDMVTDSPGSTDGPKSTDTPVVKTPKIE